jgi:hypothetical protein
MVVTPDQSRLIPEFFVVGLLEKKVYHGGMSILSILLSIESACHSWPRGTRVVATSLTVATGVMTTVTHFYWPS